MMNFETLTMPDIPVLSVLSAFSVVKIHYD